MLRTIFIFFMLSVAGVYIQSSFFPKVFPFSLSPDFILVLVVWIALFKEERSALLGAFFLGLLSDFASGLYLGPQAAGSVLACMLVQGVSRHVYADRFFSIAMVSGISSLVKQLAARILVLSFTGFQSIFDISLYVLFGQAALTAAVAPLIIHYVLFPRKKKVL